MDEEAQNWPRIVCDQYDGDPFKKIVLFRGKHYLLDESALIEQQEKMYQSFIDNLFRKRDE